MSGAWQVMEHGEGEDVVEGPGDRRPPCPSREIDLRELHGRGEWDVSGCLKERTAPVEAEVRPAVPAAGKLAGESAVTAPEVQDRRLRLHSIDHPQHPGLQTSSRVGERPGEGLIEFTVKAQQSRRDLVPHTRSIRA